MVAVLVGDGLEQVQVTCVDENILVEENDKRLGRPAVERLRILGERAATASIHTGAIHSPQLGEGEGKLRLGELVLPAFVKAEMQLYPEGPIWRVELTSPVWSH